MKKIVLLMGLIAITAAANAQPLNTYRDPQYYGYVTYPAQQLREVSDTKLYISPSYGVLWYAGGTSAIQLTAGYNISKQMRLSLWGNMGLSEDYVSGLALMLGTTEIYSSPYSLTFTELSFGIGYQTFYAYSYNNYVNSEEGFFFPIRFKWGYSLTRNLDFGLDLMLALTTNRNNSIMLNTSLFFAIRL